MFPHDGEFCFCESFVSVASAAPLPSPTSDPSVHSLAEWPERCMGEEY